MAKKLVKIGFLNVETHHMRLPHADYDRQALCKGSLSYGRRNYALYV